IFRCSGFRRLGKPSSSLKVTSINDTKFRSFRKKFKKITLRDLAKKIEEKSEKVLKFLQIEPRGLSCTEKHQK
ncbi:hypothetical protein, partial [Vibrio parahaemolyticus]|uniref:hypothetical protein n=1 Tax=Vibrio parahaemolyticus TaxID=670 RepID=UPI001C606EB3